MKSELYQKSKPELNRMLQDLRNKLSQFRFKLGSNKVKNAKEIGQTKKDIARILTILNKQEK